VPTLLHISDLHRTSGPRLKNDELLMAITNDAMRWEQEDIPCPDLIVVSGDLIQGTKADTADPDPEIEAQYEEAGNFLCRLAAHFVNSDMSRVVIVPGNHDVHWGRARRAMEPLTECPDRIDRKAFEATSNVRWNWRDQRAYTITDSGLYMSRFEHFRKFQAAFYAGLNPNPLQQDESDLIFFDYESLGLVIVGFASWHGNDCFCPVGAIAAESLVVSQRLLSESKAPVAIGVWHHGVVGGPTANDYMDQHVIHRLIDLGFTVGLHGHHHYAAAAPFEVRLPNRTSMVVAGAGSLAVGDGELPMGEHRQFNVVDIDPESSSVTVHVREMSPAGVFTGSHRSDFGGNSFIKLDLPLSAARPKKTTAIQHLDKAMTAVATGQYEWALELLSKIGPSHSDEKRQVEIQALEGLGQSKELIRLLDLPRTADEVTKIISLLLDNNRFDEAEARLETASALVDRATCQQLAATIAVRRMTS
jgi:hypothetical protein